MTRHGSGIDRPTAGGSPATAAPPSGWSLLGQRRRQVMPFAVIGTLCVIAGGLLAAVTAPAPTEHATWAAAYLVLICGVAQVGLGLGQALCARHTPTPVVVAQLIGWNVGNAAVLAGTLTGDDPLVDVGGALLVVTLILLGRQLAAGSRLRPVATPWFRYGYGLLIAVLLISVPVGLVLARLRS